MIVASGDRPDGAPRILIGLKHSEVVRMLADEPIVVQVEHINPLLPPMELILTGGVSNDEMIGQLRARWPAIWEVPGA